MGRLSRIERVERSMGQAGAPKAPVQGDAEELLTRICGGVPLTTQREFILSPERRAWYTGPVGSGKTAALVGAVLFPAMLYPGSKWLVARATYWTLEETTLRDFLNACERLGPNLILDRQKGPPYKLWIASALRKPDGTPCEPAEVMIHSLDDPEKLGSTKFTGIVVDEANEIDETMATTADSRLRWRLPGQSEPIGPFFLRFVSNPVRRSHWLHRKFCGEADSDPVPWGKKFKSLPGENSHNLPPGYYQTISSGMTPEQRLRLVEGECGPDPTGQGVFTENWRPDFHASASLVCNPILPMIRGWDFGRRRPAVVWAQRHPNGWVNRLGCMLGENEGLERFGTRVIERSNMQFPGVKEWQDFVDPHGVQKRDVSDESSIDLMRRRLKLHPVYRDVSIEAGLSLMEKGLTTLIKGRPRSMYHRVDCQLLIEGYGGGYCWPTGRGKLKEKPLADGFYEHVMDADRYIEVNLAFAAAGLDLTAFRRSLRKK